MAQPAAQTWGAWLSVQAEQQFQVVSDFVERNFTVISFVASSIFMNMYAAPLFMTGAAVGAALHHYWEPNLKVDPAQEKIITVYHATLAIVGAVATLVTMIQSAGLIASSIPFFASFAAGSAAYRAYAAWGR